MATTEAVRLYTVADAAGLLDVGKDYVYRAVAAGELSVVELGHGRAKQRVRADTLQAFIDARTFPAVGSSPASAPRGAVEKSSARMPTGALPT